MTINTTVQHVLDDITLGFGVEDARLAEAVAVATGRERERLWRHAYARIEPAARAIATIPRTRELDEELYLELIATAFQLFDGAFRAGAIVSYGGWVRRWVRLQAIHAMAWQGGLPYNSATDILQLGREAEQTSSLSELQEARRQAGRSIPTAAQVAEALQVARARSGLSLTINAEDGTAVDRPGIVRSLTADAAAEPDVHDVRDARDALALLGLTHDEATMLILADGIDGHGPMRATERGEAVGITAARAQEMLKAARRKLRGLDAVRVRAVVRGDAA